jgi:hypothetical protein
MARDQDAVLGGHEIRLDVVRAQLDGQPVARERVVGQVARGPAVADYQRTVLLRKPAPLVLLLADRCGRCEEGHHG